LKFWDSSALLPLFIDEPSTEPLRALMADDADVVTWLFTVVELLSAMGRLERQSAELGDLIDGVRAAIRERESQWTVVTHVEAVRRRAERIVGLHPLSAADALQLAAAQVVANDQPETLPFVTLDRVLGKAARLEGFHVISAS
jgi:predicted nucleic acid-binding protein